MPQQLDVGLKNAFPDRHFHLRWRSVTKALSITDGVDGCHGKYTTFTEESMKPAANSHEEMILHIYVLFDHLGGLMVTSNEVVSLHPICSEDTMLKRRPDEDVFNTAKPTPRKLLDFKTHVMNIFHLADRCVLAQDKDDEVCWALSEYTTLFSFQRLKRRFDQGAKERNFFKYLSMEYEELQQVAPDLNKCPFFKESWLRSSHRLKPHEQQINSSHQQKLISCLYETASSWVSTLDGFKACTIYATWEDSPLNHEVDIDDGISRENRVGYDDVGREEFHRLFSGLLRSTDMYIASISKKMGTVKGLMQTGTLDVQREKLCDEINTDLVLLQWNLTLLGEIRIAFPAILRSHIAFIGAIFPVETLHTYRRNKGLRHPNAKGAFKSTKADHSLLDEIKNPHRPPSTKMLPKSPDLEKPGPGQRLINYILRTNRDVIVPLQPSSAAATPPDQRSLLDPSAAATPRRGATSHPASPLSTGASQLSPQPGRGSPAGHLSPQALHKPGSETSTPMRPFGRSPLGTPDAQSPANTAEELLRRLDINVDDDDDQPESRDPSDNPDVEVEGWAEDHEARYRGWVTGGELWIGTICRLQDAVRGLAGVSDPLRAFYRGDHPSNQSVETRVEFLVAAPTYRDRECLSLGRLLKELCTTYKELNLTEAEVEKIQERLAKNWGAPTTDLDCIISGTWHAELLAAVLHFIAMRDRKALVDTTQPPSYGLHPLELPTADLLKNFEKFSSVMAISKRSCPSCTGAVNLTAETEDRAWLSPGTHSDWYATCLPPWTSVDIAKKLLEKYERVLIDRLFTMLHPDPARSGQSGGTPPAHEIVYSPSDQVNRMFEAMLARFQTLSISPQSPEEQSVAGPARASEPSVPAPEILVPDISTPDISVQDVDAPDVDMPDVSGLGISVPTSGASTTPGVVPVVPVVPGVVFGIVPGVVPSVDPSVAIDDAAGAVPGDVPGDATATGPSSQVAPDTSKPKRRPPALGGPKDRGDKHLPSTEEPRDSLLSPTKKTRPEE
ncbi:hypothetical protein K4K56_011524 [Colletotrichum sp. SAR 10_98]|nr:hypothetical protein K4K56_011524 [Colletotrichum sp. SAR 10_98]